MGLDCFWRQKSGNDFEPVKLSEAHQRIVEAHPLCGGMLSGHGLDSFRGKVYSDLVERVTGQTLYQDWINPEKVREMARLLSQSSHSQACSKVGYRIDPDEWRNLQVVFDVYAKAGAGIVGWW